MMKLDESGAEENKGKNNNVYCRHGDSHSRREANTREKKIG